MKGNDFRFVSSSGSLEDSVVPDDCLFLQIGNEKLISSLEFLQKRQAIQCITYDAAYVFPSADDLRNIRYLDVSRSCLSDQFFDFLPKLTNLNVLIAQRCASPLFTQSSDKRSWDEKLATSVASLLRHSRRLCRLDLENSMLQSCENILSEGIRASKSLRMLSLQNCMLCDSGVREIVRALDSKKIMTLRVGNNGFGQDTVDALKDLLEKAENLLVLDIGSDTSVVSLESFLELLKGQKTLRRIVIGKVSDAHGKVSAQHPQLIVDETYSVHTCPNLRTAAFEKALMANQRKHALSLIYSHPVPMDSNALDIVFFCADQRFYPLFSSLVQEPIFHPIMHERYEFTRSKAESLPRRLKNLVLCILESPGKLNWSKSTHCLYDYEFKSVIFELLCIRLRDPILRAVPRDIMYIIFELIAADFEMDLDVI